MRENTSLHKLFKPGDRVYRKQIDYNENYEGIILSITNDSMEIFWDSINGKYNPIGFTRCSSEEVFDGTNEYTPIKHKHFLHR